MTATGPDSAERHWAGFRESSRRRHEQRLKRDLLAVEQDSPDSPRTAAELAETVASARDVGVVFDEDLKSRISMALKRLLTGHATGSVEPSPDEIRSAAGMPLGEIRALVEELGVPTGDSARERLHRLALAQVHARTDRAAASRGAELEAALALCRTNREHLEVAIMCAQYQVDIGECRAAERLLADSRQLVGSDASCADLLPELAACEAGMFFAQGRFRRARRRFHDTLAAMDRHSRNHHERPGIKAYHYLGKIHARYGRYGLAVRDLVHAEVLVARRGSPDPRQSGHNHARLGEVLSQAGSVDARWHLSCARDLFLKAGEESSGRGQLEGVAKAPGEQVGKQIERYEHMLDRARNNLHWRGVVIASMRLMLAHGRKGAWRHALSHAGSGVTAVLRVVRGSGILAACAGAAELAVASAAKRTRWVGAKLVGSPALRCPCRPHLGEVPIHDTTA